MGTSPVSNASLPGFLSCLSPRFLLTSSLVRSCRDASLARVEELFGNRGEGGERRQRGAKGEVGCGEYKRSRAGEGLCCPPASRLRTSSTIEELTWAVCLQVKVFQILTHSPHPARHVDDHGNETHTCPHNPPQLSCGRHVQ